jgi:uncharacterized protein (DUF2267 family)
MVDVSHKRVFTLEAPGAKAFERELNLGELLHLLAVTPGLTVDQLDLTRREQELVELVVEQRDRAPSSRPKCDPQPVLRAAFALVDSEVRSGDRLDALLSHLSTKVREYRAGL